MSALRMLAVWGFDLFHYRVEVERGGFLTRRELDEVLNLLCYDRLHEIQLRHVIDHPVKVRVRVEVGSLERIAPQADNMRQAKLDEGLGPLLHRVRALDR